VVQALGTAMHTYQRKNMRCAFDAVATLAENAGDAIKTPEAAAALLPPLLQKWEAGGDSQPDLYQLLECVTSVAMGVGLGAQDYAAPMFTRALQLARHQLSLRAAAARGGDVAYEADHVICALDLLSGLADGMAAGVEALVSANAAALREVLLASCSDPQSPGIRRSAFALVGDIAKSGCGQHIHAALPSIMECAAANLQPNMVAAYNMSVCNNACWSAGEIATAFPAEVVAPFVPPLATALVSVLQMTMVQRSLGENAAIALGRLALKCPEQLSAGFGELVLPWCGALRRLRDGAEKEQAFAGLVRLVQINPAGGTPGLVAMMNAIASWQFVQSVELHTNLTQVMSGYEQHLGPEQWGQLLAAVGAAVQRKLANFANINTRT
jgi:transportin-1